MDRGSFPFPLDSTLIAGSCFIPHVLPEIIRLSSSNVCVQSPTCLFPLPLDLPCAAAAPEEGFSSCLSREEKCFSSSLFEAPHYSLEIHPLTAEADDKTILTESRHRVLNDCTLGFFRSTSKISLKSKTDSSVWLTLNYSWTIRATCLPARKAFFL